MKQKRVTEGQGDFIVMHVLQLYGRSSVTLFVLVCQDVICDIMSCWSCNIIMSYYLLPV